MTISFALRFVAIAVWVAWLVAMASWGETTLALAGAAVGTFALGAFIGRWWVLLTVLVPGFVLALYSAAAGTENTGHGSGVDWALWVFVPATIVVAAVMALGVSCHRLALRGRPLRTGHEPLDAR
jgi:hypothetical protein